jgi:hypothetical protein
MSFKEARLSSLFLSATARTGTRAGQEFEAFSAGHMSFVGALVPPALEASSNFSTPGSTVILNAEEPGTFTVMLIR